MITSGVGRSLFRIPLDEGECSTTSDTKFARGPYAPIVTSGMTSEQRHRAMAANRGRTRPERKLAAALWAAGARFYTGEGYRSRTGIKLRGQPDIVFSGSRVIVFFDGCFWHGCRECHPEIESMTAQWREKIARNVHRDGDVTDGLRASGWTVLRVREHEVRDEDALEMVVLGILQAVQRGRNRNGTHPQR